uniref:DUF5899 domain-containing protein n=1 Tax=viral metagenome TaxID=1070528 RepID=A0A6C0B308_9ZZZZ
MEMVIPLFALSSLYLINSQSKKENFQSKKKTLPNVDIPNRNFPQEMPVIYNETDLTSELSTVNKFNSAGGVYTDKFFDKDSVAGIILESNNQNTPNGPTYASDTSPMSQDAYYSLTGNKVGADYFQHNNMVPFFGSNVRSSQINANSNESVLDNYTGSGSQIQVKREVSPMFKPSDNEQWAYGAPNNSDFFQSRVNPSMRMGNVNPFEKQQVAPGLGLGYTNEGSNGFNSGMMMRDHWLDRGVDELRVLNKPKASGNMLYGHEGPAANFIQNGATTEQMGVMEKHRPDRTFEMFDNQGSMSRLMTTTGAEKGQTMRAIPVDRETSRQNNTSDYIGNAGYNNGGEYVNGEYMPTHNIELGEFPLGPANAQGRNYAAEGDFEMRSKFAYPNNRTVNKQGDYYGLVSGGLKAAVAPLLDILRPSRKENAVGNLRPYQNPGTRVSNSYIFNPNDKLSTTHRETTENSKYVGNINRNQNGGAYESTPHQVSNTARAETGDFSYSGIAGGYNQMKSYDAEYNQRNNDIKSSTIDGRMVPGNMSLMNGNINMTQANRDGLLANKRAVAATMPFQSPDVSNMGKLQGHDPLYQNIQMDRTDGDILTALQSNPYVVNYKNGL